MSTMQRSVRAELMKLTTTRMPWAFLLVLLVMGAINAATVAFGTDMDGSKAFVSTAADQQSLIAFSINATMIAGLFGAIAASREYAHQTVIPTFLADPGRQRAVVAQLVAVAIGGAVLGAVGAGISTAAVAVTLPTTEFGFMVPALDVARVLAAAAFCGAAAAVIGAGIGIVVRNVGGAVTGAVLVLIVAPPMLVQLISSTAEWIPASLALDLSGVEAETTVPAAAAALLVWALVPAVLGAIAVRRRDVA
jgi:hypothetical protein